MHIRKTRYGYARMLYIIELISIINTKIRLIKNIFIFNLLLWTMTSCGPRSGVSNRNEARKDYALVDSSKIILQSEAQLSGKILFMQHCRQCHVPISNNIHDGNSLQGLFDRIPKTEDYFRNFILNSDSVKKSGDPYANKIDQGNNVDYEHRFQSVLSTKDIQDIAEYIKLRPTD